MLKLYVATLPHLASRASLAVPAPLREEVVKDEALAIHARLAEDGLLTLGQLGWADELRALLEE